MSFLPLWPNLNPRQTEPLWFNADRAVDDETEVLALEAEHKAWVSFIFNLFSLFLMKNFSFLSQK